MSRFIPQRDMSASDILSCVMQARAIIGLCERAAWADIQNSASAVSLSQVADDIQSALQLANDLLDPVQDALESHEGLKGGEGDD
jgi:hypothetical protein